VLRPPDRSRLKEMFRQYEFRNLLQRIDVIDEALPAAPMRLEGVSIPWREADLEDVEGEAALVVEGERFALAREDVVLGDWSVEVIPRIRDARLVAHDFKALPREVYRAGIEPTEDTLLMAYLIEPARADYALDELAAEYGIELQPDPAAEEETADLIRHAGAALRLTEPLKGRIVERGLESLYREIELPLVGVLAAMEDAGVRIDTYRMGEITARLADRVEELETKAHELAGEEFMLGSTQQVARILFEKLELTAGRKGKTGYSTDTRVLRSIRGEHPIVEVIEEWREYSKLMNTYLGPLPELISEEDGRLHTTFNQAVASTGRLSTTNPNLQSIPIRTELGREIRSAFVADQGFRLLSADYSQVELRILAHVAGEDVLKEIFQRGEDVHAATAAEVLKLAPEEIGPGERSRAKAVNFGIVYGLSAHGLSEQLQIPHDEAAEYIERYLARFPAVRAFIGRTIAEASERGYVTTLFGRRRDIPELRSRKYQTRSLGERLAVNTVIQGTAADIIKIAMVRADRRLRERGMRTRLVLTIHDELLFEGPEDEVEAATSLVREEMEGAFTLDPPLKVDVGVGDNWLDAK
jgi:DNA polymerase I